ALLLLEMLVVVDQHDSVARRNPKHGEKTDQGTERDDAVAQVSGDHSAHQSRRQGEEGERGQPRAAESGHQEQESPERSEKRESEQPLLGGLPLRVLSQYLGVVAERKLHLAKAIFHIGRD